MQNDICLTYFSQENSLIGLYLKHKPTLEVAASAVAFTSTENGVSCPETISPIP